ncbi:hypothetical protein [Fictibacillus sp. S7]|uniref:hypothetical protein n=1 Tax=Fictibacillus sp. S7 TaxID=2212476 RepID=UPI001010BFB4|nr:hypothetical protein [Fictibacillus sp. S7]RXZ00477.1 hypothetical protein DMO16_12785 [Fictibacillus sp. S7]
MNVYEYTVVNVVMAFEEKDLNIIDEHLMKVAYKVADDFTKEQISVSLITSIVMDIMPGIIHIEAGPHDWQFDLDGNYIGNGMFNDVSVELVGMV